MQTKMVFRKHIIILLLCFLTLSEVSCIRELGITFPSINSKGKKKKMGPTYEFNSALFSYRQKYGYWPKSELDFSAYNSKVIKDLQYKGIEEWNFGRFSDDTLYINWVHEPIQDGTHVGIVPIPDKKIYLISRYVFPNRDVSTKFFNKRKFMKESARNI